MAHPFTCARHCVAGILVALLASGCGGGHPEPGAGQPPTQAPQQVGPVAPERSEPTPPGAYTPLAAPSPREQARSTGNYSIDTTQREAVRLFYNAVYQASEGIPSEWSGNVAACAVGDTSAAFKNATLRRINWFRAMAGVPANIQFDATFNAKAQQAALVMSANQSLSHSPPASWACNTASATQAASSSNLALGTAGPNSIVGYMQDSGSNNAAVGHRRWLLYPQTQAMGTGDITGTTQTNALWVFDNQYSAPRPTVRNQFVAWPPPGHVPYQTVYPRWSFSYPQADFSTATVLMTENGTAIPTRTESVSNSAGENTLVWLPGSFTDSAPWPRPLADTTYTVQITGVNINGSARNFSYSVQVFDPDTPTQPLTLSGPQVATVGQSAVFSVSPQPGATAYQWRSVEYAAASFNNGAEGDLSPFTIHTSSGYTIQATGVAATGNGSFHLAHPQPTDQTLTLLGEWVPGPQTTIGFASRLALASPNQHARAELSQDGGNSWSTLFQQSGTQTGSTSSFGESAFSQKHISLVPYQGKTIQLRFRYSFTGGTYYPQTSNNAGWFIDDIAILSANRVTTTSEPVDMGNATQFSLVPAQAGSRLLQVRPGVFGLYGGWSTGHNLLAQPASTGPSSTAIDCLLDWAQQQFPQAMAPAGTTSQTAAPFRYRHYPLSGIYVGVSTANQTLYVLQQGQLQSLGSVFNWLSQAQCSAN